MLYAVRKIAASVARNAEYAAELQRIVASPVAAVEAA